MEDILASIRRIIADDQLQAGRAGLGSLKRANAPALPVAVEPSDEDHLDEPTATADSYDDVLDLARMPEAVVAEPVAAASAPAIESYGSVSTTRKEAYSGAADNIVRDHGPVEPYVNDPATSMPSASEPTAHLQGSGAEPAVQAQSYVTPHQPGSSQEPRSQRDLTDALLSPALGASVMSSFETLAASVVLQNDAMLERVMHDTMRPLIKTWLEENLPTIVERLVRVEIERVARGGRG